MFHKIPIAAIHQTPASIFFKIRSPSQVEG